MGCCCVIMFSTVGIIANCMTVFLAGANADTGIDMVSLSLYFTFVTLTIAVCQPVSRLLFERYNARIVVAFFAALPGIGTALMALYNKPVYFWISGIINGFGLSLITFILVPTLMNKWFVTRIGFVMGICMAFSNIGGAIWAPVAGNLVVNMGWRTTVVIMGILSIFISCPVALIGIRRDPFEKSLQPYGINTIQKGDGGQKIELSGDTLKESLKRPWIYMIFIIAAGLFFIANFQPQITQYAVSIGFPINKGAAVSSMLMIGSIIGKVALGAINDKAGLGVSVTVGIICGIIGSILLISSGGMATMVFVGAMLFGIAFALMSIALPLYVRKAAGTKHFGSVYSVVSSVGNAASAVSGPIYGAIYEATGSYATSLVTCVVFMAVVLVMTWIIIAGTKNLWKNA
jgi:MFS family permease